MRHAAAVVAASLFLALVAGCTPQRDNPNDPAVRPLAVIGVRVDGVSSAVGGRGRAWTLDATSSTSPTSHVTGWSWQMADRTAASASDPSIQWIAVGASAQIISLAGTTTSGATFSQAFHDALAQVNDFGVDGSSPTTRWVQLTVRDSSQRRNSAVALITLENHAPVLSLGPDLRVSPGGKWWLLPSGSDVLTAAPIQETLTLQVADADGDQDAVGTAQAPARWRVFGALSATLDLDHDGFVDDAFFASDATHRSLTFDAPVVASRNKFQVFASDVGSVSAGAPANAVTTLNVNVQSNPWIYDSTAARFVRPDTTRTDLKLSARTQPVATDGARALLVEQGATKLNLRVVDQTLGDVRRVNTTAFDALDYITAAPDGAGGWWVAQGNGGAEAGHLLHFHASGTALVGDLDLTNIEGGAASEFNADFHVTLVPTQDGTKDVWAVGVTDSIISPPPTVYRLYRISTAGAIVHAQTLPAALNPRVYASDGAGGILFGGVDATTFEAEVSHFDATGTALPSVLFGTDPSSAPCSMPLPCNVSAIGRDAARARLWITFAQGNTEHLGVQDSDGSVHTQPAGGTGLFGQEIFPDETDGSVLAVANAEVVTRFVLNPDGTLDAVDTLAHGYAATDAAFALQGGSLLLAANDFAGPTYHLLWFEAAANSPRISFSAEGSPIDTFRYRFGVDPATGFLWITRPQDGAVEVRAQDGTLVRTIPITTGASGLAMAIALDPQTRTAWVPWSSSASSVLAAVSMDGPAVVTTTAGIGFDSVTDVDVVPGGMVCIGGYSLASGTAAWGFLPSTGTASSAVPVGGSDVRVAADATGSCWFTGYTGSNIVHLDSQFAPTTFASPVNPGTGNPVQANGGATVASWSGVTWIPDATFNVTTTDWVVRFGPGNAGVAGPASAPVFVSSPAAFLLHETAIVQDPFYRHFWVTFGAAGLDVPGELLRFDQNFVEVYREGDLLSPEVHGNHG